MAESLSQHDEKHVVLTSLSGIRVGRRRRKVNDNDKKHATSASSSILLHCDEL
jgi:hypothetical protein